MGARIAVAAALLCAVLCPVATAAPTWLPSGQISGTGDSSSAEVAMSPQGEVMAAWQETNLVVAVRPPGGSFTTVLKDIPGGSPLLAYDKSGNALAVWWQGGNVWQAFRPAGGSFDQPKQLSDAVTPDLAYPLDVEFDSQGNAIVAWNQSGGGTSSIKVAFRPAGGQFGTPTPISTPGKATANAAAVAFDQAGNAIAVWQETDGTNQRVATAFRPVGGNFGTPAPISAAGQDASSPKIAVDHNGNALAVWVRPETNGGFRRTQASFRPAGGSFQTTADTISPTVGGGGAGAETPQVAFDSHNNAIVTWMRGFWIEAAFRPAGSGFDPAQRVSPATNNAWAPRIAFDPNDNALIAWYNEDASHQATAFSIRPPGGTFSSPFQPISDPSTAVYWYSPRLAVDAQGDAVALWLVTDSGGDNHVWVAGYDGAPPQFGASVFPTGGRVGDVLNFSAPASDVWSAFTTTWDFGDGTTAPGPDASHAYAAAGTVTARATATDAVGNSASTSKDLVLDPRVTGIGDAVTLTPRDTIAPVISAFRVIPASFRVTAARAAKSAAVRYRLSEASRVTFKVQRAKRVKKRMRWLAVRGSFSQAGKKGANSLAFSGRVGKRALKPGAYRLVATAKDAAGNKSKQRTAPFKILPKKKRR